MKNKNYHIYFVSLLIISGCSFNYSRYLNTAQYPLDRSYGLVPENPVCIGNFGTDSSQSIIEEFISRFSTENFDEYQIINKRTIPNPLMIKPPIEKINIWTGKKLRYGSGPFLEEYTIKPKNGSGIIKIYFNIYKRNRRLYVPYGIGYGHLSGK